MCAKSEVALDKMMASRKRKAAVVISLCSSE